MKRIISVLVISLLACVVSVAKSVTFHVNIHGANYDKLKLSINTDSPRPNDNIQIYGSQGVDNSWTFKIPDSVYERYCDLGLDIPSTDSIPHHSIKLQYKLGNDTLKFASFCIAPQNNTLDISYVSTDTFRNVLHVDGFKTDVMHNFMVNRADKEVEASLVQWTSSFCFFGDSVYSDDLAKYAALVRRYPNSHALVSGLYMNRTRFKTKADIDSVFSNFTTEQKQSYYGKLIQAYGKSMQAYFDKKTLTNIKLPELNTNKLENIIPQTNKAHLITFTASWCLPCRKELPMLKDIYAKYKDKLDITYVSIDDPTTIKNMVKLMVDERIPWRCLYTGDKNDEIEKLYILRGVPETILIDKEHLKIGRWHRSVEANEKEIPAAIEALLNEGN